MLLFYKYSKRTIAVVALILAVEYAVVHRISLDALNRSDVGLSQWRQLLADCNSSDCPVRHFTLIHDGLYQRAYSVHLLHRVLAISSEDGDPYDAFDDDEVDTEDTDDDDDDSNDNPTSSLVPSLPDGLGVPYAYAPGDMLSNPAPVAATLQVAGSRLKDYTSSGSAAVPALPSLSPSDQTPLARADSHHQETQLSQQQRLSAPGTATAATGTDSADDSGSPRLLQAVLWQSGKVMSVFPWQLRAHFFLSLASTRMYLLMGLWPRGPAVAAAAPRRLRQAHNGHPYHFQHHSSPQQQQQQQQQQHQRSSPGQDQAAGSAGASGGQHHTHAQHGFGGGPGGHGYDTASAYGYSAGSGGFSHPHVQAQAAAHAYAQHAHGYEGLGALFGFSRTVTDESQSLAAALTALGRGVPVFLPPEMLVQHNVQEDLMASCVFKPAVKNVHGGAATTGSGGEGAFHGAGHFPLPRWRTWPSLLGRWMAHLADRIAHHGGRAAAKLRAAGAAVGAPPLRLHLQQPAADGNNRSGGGEDAQAGQRASEKSGAVSALSRWLSPRGTGAGGGGAGSQQPQHAYVECRLYRTDRVRNVSYTCPAVLTVLPSPPRGSHRSGHLHHTHNHHHHHPQQQPASSGTSGSASDAVSFTAAGKAAAAACPAGDGACPADTVHSSQPLHLQPPPHQHAQLGPRPRMKPRLLRRLWSDLCYMAYGVVMPYKWAPILAGILSPHMFLLACLPAVQSLGLMGPFAWRLCAYHVVCVVMTGADHLLLLRLATELWVRVRPRGRGPPGRNWRRRLLLAKWLLVDGFLASGWMFRAVVLGILTTKQMELWNHLYGPAFKPHPLLSCCLVLPASWLAAMAAGSAAFRLSAGYQPTSAPLLLFQEGFLSGLSSPLYSLVYISFAVLGLGGGGVVGGGAQSVLGPSIAGTRVPLWLLDAVGVTPVLTVVALDVLWNMDAAARATPLLMVIVNALRAHQALDNHGGGALGRRGRGLQWGGGGAGGGGGGGAGGAALDADADDADQAFIPRRAQVNRDHAAALKQHTSLWMLLESARWWAHQVRDAVEEEQRLQHQQHQHHQHQHGRQQLNDAAAAAAGLGQGAAAGEAARMRERAVFAVARVAMAARNVGMVGLPPRAIAGMMAAMLMPLANAPWPPRQEEQARVLDLLLEAAAEPEPAARAAAGGGFAAGAVQDLGVDGLDEVLGNGLGAEGGGEGGGGGDDGEPLVRAPDGTMRPLAALEAELRAGMATVAALRAQLAAVGRGVADLLLLGRWPPPLELPAEALGWCESVPHGFLCPITHSLMTQPALLVSPQLSEASPTYELSAIRQWLRSNRTDPTTGRFLHTFHFIHNDNLRKAIEDWVTDRLAREQEHQQLQQQLQQQQELQRQLQAQLQQQQAQQQVWQQQQQQQQRMSPEGRQPRGAGAPRLRTPSRQRLLQPSAASAAAAAADAGAAAAGMAFAGGRYQPQVGPAPGQRSVCVGTSEMGMRMQSPERFRGGGAALAGRSRSRSRSHSRGRALLPASVSGAGGAGDAGRGGSGDGPSTAALLARHAVQRAAFRQRGLQRAAPQ